MKSVDNDARSRKTAEQLKTKGNDCFHRGKLGAAIDYYTEAITLCPRWSTPIVNSRSNASLLPRSRRRTDSLSLSLCVWLCLRACVLAREGALCHKNRGNWEGVIRDCERVLELDRENLKAHYFLGLAHISRGSYATAVAFLERALKLARDTESTIKEEVWRALARAKSENHGAIAASRAVRRQDLLRKIKAALKAETGKKMQRGEHKANNIIDAAEELERDTGLLEEIFHSDEIRYRGDDIPNWCTCQVRPTRPARTPPVFPPLRFESTD